MTHSYSKTFARIYDARWGDFAEQIAPLIQIRYEMTSLGQIEKSVLDVGCGTGHVIRNFLHNGYQATGIDLSPHMLEVARDSLQEYVERGQAHFIVADATNFRIADTFGLVISTYDMLNHLPDEAALNACFGAVWQALKPGGMFLFDLNTREGLRQRWNTIMVEDTEELLMVQRGIYDGGDRAYTRITGFTRMDNGLYERFEETVFNTVFDFDRVQAMLQQHGFTDVYFARGRDLETPVEQPETLGRAFIIASRPTNSI